MIRKFPDLRRLDHLCEEYFEPLFGILDCCFRIALFGHVDFISTARVVVARLILLHLE